MTRAEAEKLVAECGSKMAAARKAGLAESTFRDLLKRNDGGGRPAREIKVAGSAHHGRNLNEFRQAYDKDTIIPQRVRTALKALGSGWEYEVAFAKMAGVSLADLGNYREQFVENWHQIRTDGRKVWSGSKATIAEIRKMVS